MYTIELAWWLRSKTNFSLVAADSPRYTKLITADTLKECMDRVRDFQDYHDLYKYTTADICDVWSDKES